MHYIISITLYAFYSIYCSLCFVFHALYSVDCILLKTCGRKTSVTGEEGALPSLTELQKQLEIFHYLIQYKEHFVYIKHTANIVIFFLQKQPYFVYIYLNHKMF